VTLLSPRVTPFHSRNAGRRAAAVEPDAERLNAGGEAARTMLDALARVMTSRDGATAAHARRVQEYASALALEVCAADGILLEAVQTAALLHDIGKLAIPDRLLHKPGPLTREEYEQVKLHAVIGADMLATIDFPGPLVPIVRHHHENWDGSGYPHGLSGDHIPFGARLLAIVDCYDALTSERPYRKGLPHDRALRMIAERRSTSFDPAVCDAFLRVVQGLRLTAAPSPPDVVPPYAFRLNVPRLV
jgi:putative nucleotidyltransferase with HDIG domain